MTTQDQDASLRITLDEVLQATQAVTKRFGDEYFTKLDKVEGYPHDYIKALMDAGLHTVMIPAEYGGMGLGLREACVIVEEMHRSGGIGSMIHGQMFMMGILARHGSDDQKRKILEEVVAGRVRLQSFSLTEPNAGTDTSKMTTKGTKEGNEWVIKGQKLWTSRFDHTDAFMVFARTSPPKDPAKAYQGISAFLVDKRQVDPKQYTSRKIDVMFNHHTYEVFYDNMRVPENSLIGEEGKGFKYLLDGLNAERIIIASEAIGDGRWFVDKAVNYAKERVLFGRPIGANQGSNSLSRSAMRIWKLPMPSVGRRLKSSTVTNHAAAMQTSPRCWPPMHRGNSQTCACKRMAGSAWPANTTLSASSATPAFFRSRQSRPTWC